MVRISCTCSCGSQTWVDEFDDGKPEFKFIEGIADDCENCDQFKQQPQSVKVDIENIIRERSTRINRRGRR